ncbi:MAG: hypothetical protein MAG581_01983 [Deltaproteobacteria bacterium]|jgi:hypothetical protein|nr:hypothetical protein [Deltaproteobacteria bacterium]
MAALMLNFSEEIEYNIATITESDYDFDNQYLRGRVNLILKF